VVDVFSRRVVGWAMANHLRTELVVAALNMAIEQRRPTSQVIHHSDQGSQYTSVAFGHQLREAGLAASMGSVGDCFDKTCAAHYTSFRRSGRFSLGRRG
ncbi:MAG: DDE-type integrase/transposase/recombinase, partial [Chloroflexi bacterium]|nr:DDE-type integrase/transposase/recombinase [Chloroflexota bacterium]